MKFLSFLTILFSISAQASLVDHNIVPKRNIQDVSRKAKPEAIDQILNVEVVLADYELIRRDFEALSKLSDADIDRWLVNNAGFIARSQADGANTPYKLGRIVGEGYRPPDYGRALVLRAFDPDNKLAQIGLIDIKGIGALKPRVGDHSDGLATLGEGIREFLYEKLVRRIFSQEQSSLKTVGTYAVLSTGFDVIHQDGTRSAAGFILRQAHKRAKGTFSMLRSSEGLEIEKMLRRYGVTSAGAYRNKWTYELMNIQGTDEGAILDFGGFLVVDKFEKPLAAFNSSPLSRYLITEEQSKALQPVIEAQALFQTWGSTQSGVADPKRDNVWLWSHDLARAWREGRADRSAFDRHFANLYGAAEKIISQVQPRTSASCTNLTKTLLNLK